MNIEDIFSEAVKIKTPADRARYLDKVCATDARLRARLEALLKAHDQSDSFLDTATQQSPPTEHPLDQDTNPPLAPRPITEGPGTMVGRYKLLQQIGEGGMGIVYMAEQEQPVRRRVALKIIKPGMDSAQVIARFEAERQALAMMDHPNIARVLDAGTTDTGRPYFVMELVQGIPITQYCDEKQLDTHARLELFVDVCNAIQHAHQKGIIHRDLKPSNVLVAIYDAKPVPKIIDFGVAKALHQRLTEKTMFTQFGAVVGTLEYMSPEQADMDLLGTDTRSDIYSLGVLLYELLTGSTPMDGKKLRSLGYAEMLKTIREVEPPKPSTRLSQSINEVASISARRQTEPRRLQKLVSGDLDWIVMKCLEKDRARRYETANGLAMDIQRHLQDEAILASPPGQLYKIQKLVRRNKLTFAAIACVMLALLLGLAASLWQAARANHEAAIALNETTRARAAEQRALTTLDELRATAPAVVAQAQALAAKAEFDRAIEKLAYAANLQPDNPEILVARGDIYLYQLKLPQAAANYRDALRLKPDFAPAQAKAQLCDQVLAAPPSADAKLSLKSLGKIYDILNAQKPSDAELKIVRDAHDSQKDRHRNAWISRLKLLPMFANVDLSGCVDIDDDDRLILTLDHVRSSDLVQLKDLPLVGLYLSNAADDLDVGMLAEISSLENVTVPLLTQNVEALRTLPKLKRLAFNNSDSGPGRPKLGLSGITADEFCKNYPTWIPRLRDSGFRYNKFERKTNGLWFLDIGRTGITDLNILRGIPICVLWICDNRVVDLSPLRGMPLTNLDISRTAVSDLSPLAGMQLAELWTQDTPVADLSPLRGMTISHLDVGGDVTDLSPILDDKNLHELLLQTATPDIQILHAIPTLERIGLGRDDMNMMPAADFWKMYEPGEWASALRKAGVDLTKTHLFADGSWDVNLDHQPISDLSMLKGAHIWRLSIASTPVSDLSPLRGMRLIDLRMSATKVTDLRPIHRMPIVYLSISQTDVRDLSPLMNMPLRDLNMPNCKQITDLSPLADITTLQTILLPPNAKNIEILRKLPNIKQIGFTSDTKKPPDQFWADYDRKQNATATQPVSAASRQP